MSSSVNRVSERDAAYWDNSTPKICAREHPNASAICGALPYSSMWTSVRRSYVTCAACLKEIERRLAVRSSSAAVSMLSSRLR